MVVCLRTFHRSRLRWRDPTVVMVYAARNPPAFIEGDDFDQWKKGTDLCCSVTDVDNTKQAVIIHLSLTGRARQASSELTADEIKCKAGVMNLMNMLDTVFFTGQKLEVL